MTKFNVITTMMTFFLLLLLLVRLLAFEVNGVSSKRDNDDARMMSPMAISCSPTDSERFAAFLSDQKVSVPHSLLLTSTKDDRTSYWRRFCASHITVVHYYFLQPR